MANSTSAAAGHYILQDKVVKMIKSEHKNDSNAFTGTGGATVSNSTRVYSQVNNSSQIRQPPNVNNNVQQIDNTTYTVNITQQQQSGSNSGGSDCGSSAASIKYEKNDDFSGPHSVVVKSEDRFNKYLPHSNTKLKSKTSTNASVQRKRKPEKAGKGLRHFSMKVCEKVKEKGTTTYNEVADELVTEEIQNNSLGAPNCDQKNIRRRVYDALNVLMAMEIISKDKKEIRWIGLPTNSVEQCTELERENEERRERIKQKHQQLRELLLQQVSFKSLIERNKEAERQGIIPTSNSSIQLPFIIVNTHKSTKINCSVTNDKSEYIFKFNDQFEMHDDAEVLKRMGLLFGLDKGECTFEDIERAKLLVPPNFEKFIEAYGNGKMSDGDGGLNCDSDDEMPTFMELTNDSQEYTRTDTYDLDDEDVDDDEDVEHSDID